MVFTCEFSLAGFPEGVLALAVGIAFAVGLIAGLATGLTVAVGLTTGFVIGCTVLLD